MAVSVRMEPLLEKELELAAKRQGVTKSQFIIDAVRRALGQRNPGVIYAQVMEEMASYTAHPDAGTTSPSPTKKAVKNRLRVQHSKEQADYAAYLAKKTKVGASI